jgi:small subunit ribosomal protein S16
MLAIRMQRTGRKGHAQFRMVVQDSRRTPSSGNIVASLGSYNPHTKEAKLDTEKAAVYLNNGAQPSDRVAALLQKEGVKMPSWVTVRTNKERTTRNADKLRKNQPQEEAVEVAEAEAAAEEIAEEETVVAEAAAAVEAAPEAPAEA